MIFLVPATVRRGERYLGRWVIIIPDKYDETRIKGQNDTKVTTKANKVRINWGTAGKWDDIKNTRLQLNVEEGGSTVKKTVYRYLPVGSRQVGYRWCSLSELVMVSCCVLLLMLMLSWSWMLCNKRWCVVCAWCWNVPLSVRGQWVMGLRGLPADT